MQSPSILLSVVPLLLAITANDAFASQNHERPEPVGLSLFFRDGGIQPIDLVGDASRYLQEIDITESIATTTDEGIDPLIHSSAMQHLNWQGIEFVEEDWREPGDGTFTRQRFYRGAKWMERYSTFIAVPKDSRGRVTGLPLLFLAGKDNEWNEGDDGFVRRFDARQITTGCSAIGDCSSATSFIAQGVVQARQALNANQRDVPISPRTTQLQLLWSEDFHTNRTVSITHSDEDDHPFGYGLKTGIKVVTPPANGKYYLPGDAVSFKLNFEDGQGNDLCPDGFMPTYGEFMSGTSSSGIHFLDLTINPTLYYALKHREGNMLFALSGPTHKLKNPYNTIDLFQFFVPQVTVASRASEGWSGVAEVIPPLPLIFGGFQDPMLWSIPNSTTRTLVIPEDAEAGTYVAAIKARRSWGGESLNRGATLSIQVGTRQRTGFHPTTGGCGSCHEGPTALSKVNHGLSDQRACVGCHAALAFEPDNALDVRVHFVHSRSDRFPGDVSDCSNCHFEDPSGPPRGFPGVGF
jgi:hypothetical protein